MKALVIMSGGLDSVVLGYFMRAKGYDLDVLTADYGQAGVKELGFARRAIQKLDAHELHINLVRAGFDQFWHGAGLTEAQMDVPGSAFGRGLRPLTGVPNRNTVLLTIGFAAAAAREAAVVSLGVSKLDWITPDCRPEFLEVLKTMQSLALSQIANVTLETPFINLSKGEIVKLGHEMGVHLEETWSCWRGDEIHCGHCMPCKERQHAFRESGLSDPTRYAGSVDKDWSPSSALTQRS
jgi:7-cyano-7-deazaguanine synthase